MIVAFVSKHFQWCNKSLINQACWGPSILGKYQLSVFFAHSPLLSVHSVLRPWGDIRPPRLVNKIYKLINYQTVLSHADEKSTEISKTRLKKRRGE